MDTIARVRSAWTLAAVLAAVPAAAAVARAVSVEELARASDAVVRGRVERLESRWSGDGMKLVTDVDVSVSGVWRGSAPARVRVTIPGGASPDVVMAVDGAPSFAAGEDVVVFLVRRGTGWRVPGLALGKFRVEGAAARPDLSGVHVEAHPGDVPEGERASGPMPVEELERRVRAAR